MAEDNKEQRLDETDVFDKLKQYYDQRSEELDTNLENEFENRKNNIIEDDTQIFRQYQDMFTNSNSQRIQTITVRLKLLSLIQKYYILVLKLYTLIWNWRLSKRINFERENGTDNTKFIQNFLENRKTKRSQCDHKSSVFLNDKLAELELIKKRNIEQYQYNIEGYKADRETNFDKIRKRLEQNRWWVMEQPLSPDLPTISILLTIWGNIVYAIMYPIVRLWKLDRDYQDNFNRLKSYIEQFSEHPDKTRGLIHRFISRYVLRRK
ncbi:MAG: hypothetical protein GY795_41485 [Desulfobacterales bacterium]|nr:hypothetical protein [Desulfobacterales bacterium]